MLCSTTAGIGSTEPVTCTFAVCVELPPQVFVAFCVKVFDSSTVRAGWPSATVEESAGSALYLLRAVHIDLIAVERRVLSV